MKMLISIIILFLVTTSCHQKPISFNDKQNETNAIVEAIKTQTEAIKEQNKLIEEQVRVLGDISHKMDTK